MAEHHRLAHPAATGRHHQRLRRPRGENRHYRVGCRCAPARWARQLRRRFSHVHGGANPYVNGLPGDIQQALAKHYTNLFAVFVKQAAVMSPVTFWGVTDGDSWKNDFPVRGRTNYPLLFDREGKPKPVFDSLIQTAKKK